MERAQTRSWRRRGLLAVVAIGSVAVLAAGCTGRGTMPRRTTTSSYAPTTPTTDGHGHSDNDHANMTTTTMMDHGHGGMDHGGGGAPGGLTQAQIDRALKLVADTKAAVQRAGYTATNLTSRGFISIGDAMTGTEHFVHPQRHYDGQEFNPDAIEAFAVRTVNGRRTLIAAMYVMENGKTMANIPNIAGDWTMFHDHVLPFRSNDPTKPGYYQLGGAYTRRTAPMLHVWLVDNPCGPFAGTDNRNMTGSCESHGH